MEADEYEHLEHLTRSFQNSSENPDPAYIFYRLKADGVFYYVATADEMGLNFYSAERQRDVINYEAQWVFHEHSANTIFPEQESNIQKMLMDEYEKVKLQIWGDGSEPDKAMSYVQPDILSQVDALLAGLEDDSQDTTDPVHSQPEEPNIGQKRGAIRDRAAALSTTDNFFKRKQLRSPQKNSKVEHQLLENSSDSFPGNETVQEDTNETVQEDSLKFFNDHKIEKLREIMECMQSSERGIPDNSQGSERINWNQTLQEENENADVTILGSESEDFQDILLPNESFIVFSNESLKQNSDEGQSSNNYSGSKRKQHSEYEKGISSPQLNGKSGKPRCSSTSLPKVIKHKKTPENKKKCLPLKERKREAKTSELRNFRFKKPKQSQILEQNEIRAPEQPQVQERNEILIEENKLESSLIEKASCSSVSESKTSRSDTSDKVAMSEKTSPNSKNRGLGQGTRKGKSNKNHLSKKYFLSETDESNTSQEVATSEKTSPKSKNRRKRAKKLGKSIMSPCNEIKETDSSTSETVEKNINVADNVPEVYQAMITEMACEVHNNKATTFTESVCKGGNAKITHSEDICEEACNQAKSDNLFSGQPDHESLSQKNCDDMNIKRNVINVGISASIANKENQQQAILQAETMLYLHVNFQVENVMIHSTKFKITKETFNVICKDEKKLECLKKKFYAVVPSKYKNHEMLLDFAIHESFFEGSGTSLFKSLEQDPLSTPENEYSDQNPQPIAAVCESSNGLAISTSKTDCNDVNFNEKIISTKNISEEVFQVTSGSPFNDQLKHESIPHTVDKKQTLIKSVAQEKCDVMNFVENVVYVEISSTMPKKKNHQSMPIGENMVILQVRFLVKDVLEHFTKFKITKNDLGAIYNDKTQLDKLKKKFRSFLSPKYKHYEMVIQLTDHDALFDRSRTSCSAFSEKNSQLTSKKEYSKSNPQTTAEKNPIQNSKLSLVLPQPSNVDAVANTSSTICVEQTTCFQKDKSSPKQIHACKDRKDTLKNNTSLTSLDPPSQGKINSQLQFVEQPKVTETGNEVSHDMDVKTPRLSQTNTGYTNNKSKPRTVLNSNDGGESPSKMHHCTVYDDWVSPGKPHDTVKLESESFIDETNESVREVLTYLPPAEKVSDDLTSNEFRCMKSRQVLNQEYASVKETTNTGSFSPSRKGSLEIVGDKSSCTLSPSTTLHENSLHPARSDASVSSTNSNAICSFYFFSKRNQSPLLTKKSTKPSSDSD